MGDGTKRLEVERLDGLNFRIREQTHRGTDFGDGRWSFTSSGGFVLASLLFPEVPSEGLSKMLKLGGDSVDMYVMGTDRDKDGVTLTAKSEGWMARMLEAVDEYNAAMAAIPCPTPCPRARIEAAASRVSDLRESLSSTRAELELAERELLVAQQAAVDELGSRLSSMLDELGLELWVDDGLIQAKVVGGAGWASDIALRTTRARGAT